MADLIPGTGTISKIYAGSSEVQKVYAGSTLVYQVSAGTDDWDTYEDGIAVYRFRDTTEETRYDWFSVSGYVPMTPVKSSVSYDVPVRVRNNTGSAFGLYDASSQMSPTPPYIALWYERHGSVDVRAWFLAEYNATTGLYDFLEASNGQTAFHAANNTDPEFAVVNLSQRPNNISSWRDYDGPGDYNTFAYGETRLQPWASGTLFVTSPEVYPVGTTFAGITQYRTGFNGIQLNGTVASFPTDVPYIALWNATTSTWTVHAHAVDGGSSYQAYDKTTFEPAGASYPSAGDEVVMIGLESYTSGDVANWTNWDPIAFNWDNYDDGVWTVEDLTYGSSTVTEWSASSLATGTGGVDLDFEYVGSTENCTGNAYAYRFRAVGTGPPSGTTDQRSLVVWDPSTASWGEQVVGFCATARYYVNTNYSFRDYGTTVPSPSVFMLANNLLDRAIVRRFTPYNGPVANWDTYANGVKFFTTISTSSQNPVNVPSYPATTYSSAPSSILLTTSNSPVTNGAYIEHIIYDPSQTLSDSNMPPYIAMYYNEAQAVGGFADMPPGWYVFQNYDQTFRPRGRTTWEKPIAWPTPSGNYNYYSIVIDTGYASSSNTSGPFVVFLDEYNDPLGSGGTDHWTPPPYISYANPSTVLTNGIATTQSSGFDIQTDPGTYCTEYGFGDIRNSGTCRVRAAQTLGTREIDVYNGTTLYATGVGTFTGTTLTTASLTVQSGFTGNVFTDFNPVGTDADPAMIIVYTHVDRP